jgi:hypothetical protein
MRKTDLEDLRRVLQQIRSEKYPALDPQFVDAILEAEAGAIDDEAGALRALRDRIQTHLPGGVGE